MTEHRIWRRRLPSLTLQTVHQVKPWHMKLTVETDDLAPLIAAKDRIIVDVSDSRLVEGEIYAVRDSNTIVLRLFREGVPALGRVVGEDAVGMLYGLLGSVTWRGPLLIDNLPIVGRVVGLQGGPECDADPVVALNNERQWLLEALHTVDDRLNRLRRQLPEDQRRPWPQDHAAMSVNELAAWFGERDELLDRFGAAGLEHRFEALAARLGRIEALMTTHEAEGLNGVVAKLRLLWSLNYEGFPEAEDQMEAKLIKSSLTALRRMVKSQSNGTGEPLRAKETASASMEDAEQPLDLSESMLEPEQVAGQDPATSEIEETATKTARPRRRMA